MTFPYPVRNTPIRSPFTPPLRNWLRMGVLNCPFSCIWIRNVRCRSLRITNSTEFYQCGWDSKRYWTHCAFSVTTGWQHLAQWSRQLRNHYYEVWSENCGHHRILHSGTVTFVVQHATSKSDALCPFKIMCPFTWPASELNSSIRSSTCKD